jgi:mannose-6-phosphate isomerase-like protein (cupin superfamily)
MRSVSIISIVTIIVVAVAVSNQARLRARAPQQTAGSGVNVRMQAPVDKAADFPLADLQASYKDMDAKKLLTLRLVEGGKYNVNIRRLTSPERPLVHPKTADVWVVTEGSGTLVTGGELVEATRSANGDSSGSSIRGGVERVIKTGDVVFIPAGLSHGVKDTKGITWLNIRFDTKE